MILATDVSELQWRTAAFLDHWLGAMYLDAQALFLHGYSPGQFNVFLRQALRLGKAFYCEQSACKYLSANAASSANWVLTQHGVPAAGFCCLAEPLPLPGSAPYPGEGDGVELAALYWSFDDGKNSVAESAAQAPGLFVGMFPKLEQPSPLPWLGAPLLGFAWPLGANCSAASLAYDLWRPAEQAVVYNYALGLIAAFFAGLATGALGQQLVITGGASNANAGEVRLIFVV